MANLAFNSIDTNGKYVDLAQALGITFTLDAKYQIQIQNPATIIVSTVKPEKGGFYISSDVPFGYTHTGGTLWIRTLQYAPAVVNIAEG